MTGKKRKPQKHNTYIRPHPSQVLNLKLLKELRLKAGLSQWQTSRKLGLKDDTYGYYETGKIHLPLALFRELCRLHNLDPLTIAELLNLNTLPPKLIRDFKKTCHNLNTTPLEALNDFLTVFLTVFSHTK